MKKQILFLAAALTLLAGQASAQSWLDAAKKAATAAADKATGGQVTALALVGTWNYSGPGVKFESDDILSEVGGAALETTVTSKLATAYQMVGIKKGACSFVFNKDESFSAKMGARELTGTYEFDASTHIITLHFAKGTINLGSVPGHAYISGTELQLVFPVTKLVDMMTAMGSKVSSLSTVTTLLEKYKNVYLGFEFGK